MALPPATAYHRLPMRLINILLRALWPLGIGKADLSEASLVAAAQEATGLTDLGPEPFWPQLRFLLECIEREAALNPLGRYLTRQSFIRVFKDRLWAEELFKQHPEILQRELLPPVVIVGLARTGTTRLHRLLACDEAFSCLHSWESVYPVPWPESFTTPVGEPDPRQTNIEQALKIVLWMGPQIAAVHPLGALEVEEELGPMEHAFGSQIYEAMKHIPSFGQYIMEHNQQFVYEYLVKMLKLLEWFREQRDPDYVQKPWILKTPQHMADLDCLMAVFPNAKIICSHRDPVAAVGSVCSTVWNAMVRDTNHIDPHFIGRDWLHKTRWMVEKTSRIRERIPAEQQIDIQYHDINTNLRGSMERLYAFMGRPLTDATWSAMQAWLEKNRQHKHGKHDYDLTDFGVSPEQVEAELGFYRAQYNIPFEKIKDNV